MTIKIETPEAMAARLHPDDDGGDLVPDRRNVAEAAIRVDREQIRAWALAERARAERAEAIAAAEREAMLPVLNAAVMYGQAKTETEADTYGLAIVDAVLAMVAGMAPPDPLAEPLDQDAIAADLCALGVEP